MSRNYEMRLEISDITPNKKAHIEETLLDFWPFDDTTYGRKDGTTIKLCGTGTLSGGESEEEFAEELKNLVFKLNGAGCEIMLLATYLDDLPYETYHFCKDDYETN